MRSIFATARWGIPFRLARRGLLALALVAGLISFQATPAMAQSGLIESIEVTGSQRIDPQTVESYLLVAPGDTFDPDRLDRSLKVLFGTGLFADVTMRR